MPKVEGETITATEVLVLDSSTFIKEIGLMSQKGSALKHYLYCRGMQLVVPQAAAKEYERNLVRLAQGKIDRVQKNLQWLRQFLGKIGGWSAPGEEAIKDRAKVLAAGGKLDAVLLPESNDVLARAQRRAKSRKPPGHNKPESKIGDCRIWEQCLELLCDHDVVFVSEDPDFHVSKKLHPYLHAEAERVGNGRNLIFRASIEALLCDLKSAIPAISNQKIFEFIYDKNKDSLEELELNSGCRPTGSGLIEQARLTTETSDVIEVRLKVNDLWESGDGAAPLPFELSGTCLYHLGNQEFSDLRIDGVNLSMKDSDGSIRSVEGSYINLRGHMHIGGPPPLHAEQGTLE